jgi:lipooligosaccharide transport system permease protein
MGFAPTTDGAVRRVGAAPLLRRHLYVARRVWIELVAAVVEPLMYLLTFGVGLGAVIGDAPGMPGVPYAAYVAPALLAMATMNAATSESIFGAYDRLQQSRLYDTVITTPVSTAAIARSEIWWATGRGVLAGLGFLVVLAVTGLLTSWTAVLIVPGTVLVAMAFAAAGLIAGSYARDHTDFQWVQLVMLPMFLFATTFYPLSVYPGPIQAVVRALPLYQAITVIREPALGRLDAGYAVAVGYLLVLIPICGWLAARRLRAVLIR